MSDRERERERGLTNWWHCRLQQEAQEHEMEERIMGAAREKEARDKQLEQEELLAKVCVTQQNACKHQLHNISRDVNLCQGK